MRPDIQFIDKFYHTSLGKAVFDQLSDEISLFWPSLQNDSLLAFSDYPTYVEKYLKQANRIISLSSHTSDDLYWMPKGKNLMAKTWEKYFPLPDCSMDKVLLIHSLEYSRNLFTILREIWRVLKGEGEALIIVPNRTGFWSQAVKTPFGHGHQYSYTQICTLLQDSLFIPIRYKYALYHPPIFSSYFLKSQKIWEKIGHRWFKILGGVIIIEVKKRIYSKPDHYCAKEERSRVIQTIK